MRARNIKPGFYKNEELAECSPYARLLFPGLWMMADREGRLEDRPKRIKGEIFPYDNIDVEPLLNELVTHGFIIRYETDGKHCIQILTFKEHQRVHSNEAVSVLPQFEAGLVTKETSTSNQGEQDLSPNEQALRPSLLNPSLLNDESPLSENLNPESPQRGKTGGPDTISERGFSEPVEDKVREWLKYKTERNEGYKPTGLKSLLTEIANNIAKYGEEAVINVINLSMASTWKGIIWDKIQKNSNNVRDGPPQQKNNSPPDIPDDYDEAKANVLAKQRRAQENLMIIDVTPERSEYG